MQTKEQTIREGHSQSIVDMGVDPLRRRLIFPVGEPTRRFERRKTKRVDG